MYRKIYSHANSIRVLMMMMMMMMITDFRYFPLVFSVDYSFALLY